MSIIIENPAQNTRFRAAIIRGQVHLLSKGMKIRGLTMRVALNNASRITKAIYPKNARGCELAHSDLNKWLAQYNKVATDYPNGYRPTQL